MEVAAGKALFGAYRNPLTDDESVKGQIRGTANTNAWLFGGKRRSIHLMLLVGIVLAIVWALPAGGWLAWTVSIGLTVGGAAYKPATIIRRLWRRMAAAKTLTIADYLTYLETHPDLFNYDDFQEPEDLVLALSAAIAAYEGL